MGSFPFQRYWKAIVSLALVAGLGSKLVQRLDSHAPSAPGLPPVAGAPPPVASAAADGFVTAHAEVDGRVYRIIVGRMKKTDDGEELWSAAVSEDGSPGNGDGPR